MDAAQAQAIGSFGAAYLSQMQAMDVRKPYEVYPLPGSVKKTKRSIKAVGEKTLANGKSRTIYRHFTEEVTEPAGFIVKFPFGHSIRVRSQEELERLGFHLVPGLVSMVTGDVILPNTTVDEMQSKIDLISLLPPGYIEASASGEAVKLGDELPGKTSSKKEGK